MVLAPFYSNTQHVKNRYSANVGVPVSQNEKQLLIEITTLFICNIVS